MSNSYFDSEAARWEEKPHRVSMALGVAKAIEQTLPLLPEMTLLDYGCGTGLLSFALRHRVKSIAGADTSQPMLDILTQKGKDLGLGELACFHLREENDYTLPATFFDVIVSNMTLHHIEDITPVFAKLYRNLHPGGWLAVADLDQEDGSFHVDLSSVYHFGFARSYIKKLMEKAGFTAIQDSTACHVKHAITDRHYPLFLVVGQKPQS